LFGDILEGWVSRDHHIILSRVEPFLLKLLIELALIQEKTCLGEEEHTRNILKILLVSNAGIELDVETVPPLLL
jgi:hypothetical protein